MEGRIFLYFLLAFTGGIFIDSFFNFPSYISLVFLMSGVFTVVAFWPREVRKKWGIVVIGFVLIVISFGIYRHQTIKNEIVKNRVPNNISVFEAVVVGEPILRPDKIQLVARSKKFNGKILINTDRSEDFQYGDILSVSGRVRIPRIFKDFNYREYLSKDGIYFVMYNPTINIAGRDKSVYGNIYGFKNRLRENINAFLPYNHAVVLRAILLGDKQALGGKTKEKFNNTGTRHIVAISGMHIVIIAGIFLYIGLSVGMWRHQAFYFALLGLLFYIVMIGMPASAARAGIMGMFLLFAQKTGRLSNSSRLVMLAASIMLFINPLLLKLDVGFQLSFTAVLGIIFLKPIFDLWGKNIPNLWHLRDIATLTLSAQAATLPILIYNFGRFSVISPIANIFVVPVLPLVIIFGFVFSVLGLFSFWVGKILSFAAYIFINYILKVIDVFDGLSGIGLLNIRMHWAVIPVYYSAVLGLIIYMYKRGKVDFNRPVI